MAKRPLPTPEELRQLLDYNPETGEMFWKERPAAMFCDVDKNRELIARAWNKRWVGKPAFTAINAGYLTGALFSANCRAHRVAWEIYHGEWPENQIDHINGDRSDNRISNLRHVTDAENKQNVKRRSDNTSGVTGIGNFGAGKWRAQIMCAQIRHHIGIFHTFDEAVAARKKAETDMGFHKNHGRAT